MLLYIIDFVNGVMKMKNKIKLSGLLNKISVLFKSPLTYILLLCGFIQSFIYFFTEKYGIVGDTRGYMIYDQNIFMGEVSSYRTPIYPYFIRLVRKLFGPENIYNSIVFMQYIVFFISIIFFYLAVKKIIKSKLLTNISTIIYGCSPYVFLWNNLISTESLSIFAIVLLAYMTISYLKKPNKVFPYVIGVYIFGLIMLRPAFIYAVAVYIVFWIIRFFTNKSEKDNNTIGSLSMFVCLLLIFIYCFAVKTQYGTFEITYVSLLNKFSCVTVSGTYEKGDNKEIIDAINTNIYKDNIHFYNSSIKIICMFSEKKVNEFCKSVYKNDPMGYTFYIMKTVFDLGEKNIGTKFVNYTIDPNHVAFKGLTFYEQAMSPINFMQLYAILIICIILLIVLFIKNKKVAWVLAFLISMIFGNLFTTIIGSPAEHQRLFSASMPLIIMLMTYLLYVLLQCINTKKMKDVMLEIE